MTQIDLSELPESRAKQPQAVLEAAAARSRGQAMPADGRLLLVAADHGARGALAVNGQPLAMADRVELLSRLVTTLSHPGVDGVLGTADILEDLLLLGALDDKLVLGSMNRGGLAGASFEIDDRFTAYTPAAIASMGFEGGKMLTRIDYDDPNSASVLEASARAVAELADRNLMAMIEPFISRRIDGKLENDLSTSAVIRSVAIASALGPTSRHTWLKLPVVEGMERVMRATTLPTLLLGGDPSGPPDEYRRRWRGALELPAVHGLIVGRALLYPSDGNVEAAVDAAAEMVHHGG